MNYLIIAEKSEVGKAIDNAIKKNKFDPGNSYTVTSASGHLLELKTPEAYDVKYAKWRISDLPIAFPNWELVPKTDNAKTHGMYKNKLDAIEQGLAWCDKVIHAGDPDDEGQLIVDEILDHFHNTKPVLRLDVNDSTEQYILKMLGKMTDNAPLRPIGRSAYARTVADAMFGFNFSRYYTVSYNSKSPLSIGRVQTPTLGLVVNRDRQIDNHIQQSYYTLTMTATTDDGRQFPMEFSYDSKDPNLTDGKVLDPHIYDSIINAVNGKRLKADVSKKKVTDSPPLPFNLVELQSFCSKNYGITPDKTHNITQDLRSYALITYNRSGCQYLHEFQHGEAPGIMADVFGNLGITAPVDYSIKSKCFNDKYLAGEPHHAIIPTAQKYDISKLSADELKVYKAICLYYIVQFLKNREKDQTTVSIAGKNKSKFSAVAAVTTEPGYYGYMHNGKTDDKPSPITDFSAGPIYVTLSDPKVEEKKTKPPARYTQASLIKDMTCIAKYVKDPEIKKILIDKDSDKQKENGSIGTPATRDKIVSTLISRGYIKEVGSGKTVHIESTDLGKSFYDILPDSLKSADTTAVWWKLTQDIQHGVSPETVLYNQLLDQIKTFLSSPPPLNTLNGVQMGNESLGNCPSCGAPVSMGKFNAYCSAKCGLVFGKVFGKTLSADNIKKLLSGKKVKMSGLTGKNGKFDAFVTISGVTPFTYEKDGKQISGIQPAFNLEFDDVIGKCPKCGGAIVKSPKGNGYYCRQKCGMSIWKVYGKEISVPEMRKLLGGQKVHMRGFVSRAGKAYDANIRIDGVETGTYVKNNQRITYFTPKFTMTFKD